MVAGTVKIPARFQIYAESSDAPAAAGRMYLWTSSLTWATTQLNPRGQREGEDWLKGSPTSNCDGGRPEPGPRIGAVVYSPSH